MICPKCNCPNVNVQVVNEMKLKKKHKSIWYWLFIGWWWELIAWIFLTIPKLIISIFKPKKQKIVNIQKTMCTCQNCGFTWELKK